MVFTYTVLKVQQAFPKKNVIDSGAVIPEEYKYL
jgi:hypothetical protein